MTSQPALLEQLERRKTDPRTHQIHQAGDEQADTHVEAVDACGVSRGADDSTRPLGRPVRAECSRQMKSPARRRGSRHGEGQRSAADARLARVAASSSSSTQRLMRLASATRVNLPHESSSTMITGLAEMRACMTRQRPASLM